MQNYFFTVIKSNALNETFNLCKKCAKIQEYDGLYYREWNEGKWKKLRDSHYIALFFTLTMNKIPPNIILRLP